MNCSDKTQHLISEKINQHELPDSFHDIANSIYLPLANFVSQHITKTPYFISINGAQGTGKSTLTQFLKLILETEYNYKVVEFSIDDFYLSSSKRQQLAADIHPLFITRGVPGTHDLILMEQSILALKEGRPCIIPKFDKAIDEPCPMDHWTSIDHPVDIILFEGWCNQSPYQTDQQLASPINDLENKEDVLAVWRKYVNEQLKRYHQKIFSKADLSIMLKAPDFEHVLEWRTLQEHKLRTKHGSSKQLKIMNNDELKRFIAHYERITRHTLDVLPNIADIVLPINPDHSIEGINYNNDK